MTSTYGWHKQECDQTPFNHETRYVLSSLTHLQIVHRTQGMVGSPGNLLMQAAV